MRTFSVTDFFHSVVHQDAPKLQDFFVPDAVICWHNTNEQFAVEEYVRANCEYPGNWDGVVERIENTDEITIAIVKIWNGEIAFRVTSLIRLIENKICRLDEYWGDIGTAPEWRINMKIGKDIN